MRNYQGLEIFVQQQTGRLTMANLAAWISEDLRHCYCIIYGKNQQDACIVLAKLQQQTDTWNYDQCDQRIDFILKGDIICNDYVPLTYRLQGRALSFTGRCSMIGKVCGVDLYLSASYTAHVGDSVQQRFSIFLKPLLKIVHGITLSKG